MSSEKINSGTGQIANIIVKLIQTGSSEISITTESEILDPKDVEIPIKGFGKGTIDAKQDPAYACSGFNYTFTKHP